MSIINGFRTTGIYDPDPEVQGPNKNAISESVFSPTDFQKYKKELALKSTQLTVGAGPSAGEPKPPLIAGQPSTANHEVPLMEEPEKSLTAEQEHPLTATNEQPVIVDPDKHSFLLTVEQPSTAGQEQLSAANSDQQRAVDTKKELPRLELEEPSTSKRKSFEELLLDLVKNNNKNPEKPKKKEKDCSHL